MFPQPLVESGSKSPEEGSKAADLMQAIIADLEKLGAVQSELVLHNGKRLDEHAQSAETCKVLDFALSPCSSDSLKWLHTICLPSSAKDKPAA